VSKTSRAPSPICAGVHAYEFRHRLGASQVEMRPDSKVPFLQAIKQKKVGFEPLRPAISQRS
jgi:hypothetical protein